MIIIMIALAKKKTGKKKKQKPIEKEIPKKNETSNKLDKNTIIEK